MLMTVVVLMTVLRFSFCAGEVRVQGGQGAVLHEQELVSHVPGRRCGAGGERYQLFRSMLSCWDDNTGNRVYSCCLPGSSMNTAPLFVSTYLCL
jgi:hypothetical protein